MDALLILKKIESYGFVAFIVGGYVRDHILGITSFDVDIATDATPLEIKKIFDLSLEERFGSINFKFGDLNVDITTFRREGDYEGHNPKRIDYISTIEEDLKRRDFTINAICMNSSGSIIDPLNGIGDLRRKMIKVIGDIDYKLREDPLRMIRAFRFAIIYDFKIEKKALDFMLENADLIYEISYARLRMELDKILASKNAYKGLKVLDKLGITKKLEISFPEDYKEVSDVYGAWAQLDFSKNYPFSKEERTRIDNIRAIVKGRAIDSEVLFEFGLEDSLIAGEILGLNRKKILKMYDDMAIHDSGELAIDGYSIKSILGIADGPLIKKIKKDLLRKVLSGNLPNREDELSMYVKKNWK